MKKLLILILLIWSTSVKATVYHVAASGGDFATITAVNAATFAPDDQILFNKGETFFGTLVVSNSGTAGHPIIYGTYGTGVNPVITGFTTISSGWTNEGGGIYSKIISSDAQTNMVTIDGRDYGMGRYPNSTYLTYESASGHLSITDNQLSSTPNWTGAEVVIRKNDWQLDRCLVTNHSGTTITYSNALSSMDAVAGNGYFIQNDLITLDTFGEWYHDTSSGKFYMYFGAVDPTTKSVKVATKNYCITLSGQTYVTIDGLNINGSISNAVYSSSQSNNLTIQNCSIAFAGSYGAYVNSQNSNINNNTISNCNQGAVRCMSSLVNITNNTISKIGLIKGSSPIYYSSIMGTANDGGLVQYNNIDSVGYNGIFIKGTNSQIKNNFINHCCLILNDGGGIYTANTNTGMIIDHNIVLNTIGNYDGGNTHISISEGIYLDEPASGIKVTNNTCAYNGYAGIKLNRANTDTIQNNICFGNYGSQIYINNSSSIVNSTYSNVITNNQFISKSIAQPCMLIRDAYTNAPAIGIMDYNVYSRPVDETETIGFINTDMTLTTWKTQGFDANSTTYSFTIPIESDISIVYNQYATAQDVSLPFLASKATDLTPITGSTYNLQPYASMVVFRRDAISVPGEKLAKSPTGKLIKFNTGKFKKVRQ